MTKIVFHLQCKCFIQPCHRSAASITQSPLLLLYVSYFHYATQYPFTVGSMSSSKERSICRLYMFAEPCMRFCIKYPKFTRQFMYVIRVLHSFFHLHLYCLFNIHDSQKSFKSSSSLFCLPTTLTS